MWPGVARHRESVTRGEERGTRRGHLRGHSGGVKVTFGCVQGGYRNRSGSVARTACDR